jgi:DNA-binding transcriptional MerR regulator
LPKLKLKLKFKGIIPLIIGALRSLQVRFMDKEEELLSIEDVSLQLQVPKHTLRFWERAFEGIFAPHRTLGGQRRYTLENIVTIGQIKELRKKGMRLADIKKEFSNNNRGDFLNSGKVDFLANKLAEVVKTEIYSFFKREGEMNEIKNIAPKETEIPVD